MRDTRETIVKDTIMAQPAVTVEHPAYYTNNPRDLNGMVSTYILPFTDYFLVNLEPKSPILRITAVDVAEYVLLATNPNWSPGLADEYLNKVCTGFIRLYNKDRFVTFKPTELQLRGFMVTAERKEPTCIRFGVDQDNKPYFVYTHRSFDVVEVYTRMHRQLAESMDRERVGAMRAFYK